jgi:hypothetical protein
VYPILNEITISKPKTGSFRGIELPLAVDVPYTVKIESIEKVFTVGFGAHLARNDLWLIANYQSGFTVVFIAQVLLVFLSNRKTPLARCP